MTFALTIVAICASGLAILHVLRLSTASRTVDMALAWFVGSGWFALGAMSLRFLAGVPFSWPAASAIVLAPFPAWAAMRARSRQDAPVSGRRFPRPAWVFAPVGAYVFFILLVVILHGANTPTHTDDGIRVRAFAPILAFDGAWGTEARGILVTAGPVTTFVPAFAWMFTGTVDHFHANYFVLTSLIAIVLLAIGLGTSRGSPERGWASAFGLLSVPLFVYNCTSTYGDAVLAIFIGTAILFSIEYGRTRDMGDAYRAIALLAAAAMVKREGEIVAISVAAVIISQLALEWRRGTRFPVLPIAIAALAVAAAGASKIAAVGLSEAFPLLKLIAGRAKNAGAVEAMGSTSIHSKALSVFWYALFRSGNQGMVYWLLPAAIAVRFRAVLKPCFGWPLAAISLLLAETAVSSVWLVPEYTVNETTVHRALMVVSVPAALWIVALLTDNAYSSESAVAADNTGSNPPGDAKQEKWRQFKWI